MTSPVRTEHLVSEFLGTYLLVFTVGCNVLSGGASHIWGAVSIACALMVGIYALGGISGAHFNPAVSLAITISDAMQKKADWKKFGLYTGVQLLGGILGGFSYAILFWSAFNLAPAPGATTPALLCEILYTCMLCFVVLNVTDSNPKYAAPNAGNEFYGLAIAFVIIAGGPGSAFFGAGCFNPAVAFGIDTSSAGIGFGWCIVYTLVEFIGAALAAVLFMAIRKKDFSQEGAINAGYGPKEICLAEAVGTFYLVLTVGVTVLGAAPTGAFSIAAALMCVIYALGDVSGGHFNPAVTLAIALYSPSSLQGAKNGMKGWMYVASQFGGALVAGLIYELALHGKAFPLAPAPTCSWSQVFFAELVFTFVLCYVVLACAISPESGSKNMTAFAVGSCVTVGGFAVGALGGGALNPAVALAVGFTHKITSLPYALPVYWTAELLGAGIAVGLARVTHGNPKM